MTSEFPVSSQGYPSLHVISGPQGFFKKTFTSADFVDFLGDHDAFRRISVETVNDLMASQVFGEGKNLFDGGAWVFYPWKWNI